MRYGIANDRIDDRSTGRGGELGDGIIIFIWEEQFQSIPMIRCQVVSRKNLFVKDFLRISREALTFDCISFDLISNFK